MTNLYPNSLFAVDPNSVPATSRVGIIMRTQNRPILLARALGSVLAQKYHNWHLYVINDAGDIDQLEALIKPFETALGTRFTIIHRRDSIGMEAASNAGLRRALADYCEYICVHDDDDAWDSTFLQETVEWLKKPENRSFAAVVTEMIIVNERIDDQYVYEDGWEPGFVPKKITFDNMAEANQFAPVCMTLRASVAAKVGEFNEALPVLGDWDYNLRVLIEGDIGIIPKKLAYYHHRKTAHAAGTAAYGNSVTVGSARHDYHGTLFLNAMTRQLVRENPGWLGVLHVLMKRHTDASLEMRAKFEYVERALKDLRPVVQELVRTQKVLTEQLKQMQEKQ
jgi:GT2 family glycosyltransferase